MTPEEIVVQLEHCLNTKGDPGTLPNFYAAEKLVETEITEAEARGRAKALEEAAQWFEDIAKKLEGLADKCSKNTLAHEYRKLAENHKDTAAAIRALQEK